MSELDDHDWMLAWVSLLHAGTFMASAIDEYFRETLSIGAAEQDLLKQVALSGGRIKLSELARRLYLSKAGMTKMVDRLEDAGLVARQRSEEDRRVILATLTPEGRATLERSWRLLKPWVEREFRAHVQDDEILALRSALRSLLEGHGRWEGQISHLRGDPHDGQLSRPEEEGS